MDFKGWKNEMLKKQRTTILFLLFIIYTGLNWFPIAAMIITPEKLNIYQTNVSEKIDRRLTPDSPMNQFPIPYLFSRPHNEKSQMEMDRSNSIQKRRVHVRIPQLRYASKINLNLFPDLHKVVSFKRMEYRFADDFSWFGSVNKSDDIQAILTVKGDILYGKIRIHNQIYQISPISPPLHEISKIDDSSFPVEHPPVEKHLSKQKDISGDFTHDQQGDDGSVIHLMVVYTQKAAKKSKSIHALIQLAIDETNVSYEQSDIQTRLNLVHTHPVDYNEQDIVTDLNNLAHKNDGYMDEIHDLRDQYCADIVVMIESSKKYCGVSYLNPGANHGFCIVTVQCASGNYSFAHEIGHLFGARHNPEVDPKNVPYPYGHGYLHINGWRTIMAYNNPFLCPNGHCKRIMHFSNPSIRYQNIYTGTFSTHNNSRLLNESSVKLANFRLFGNKFTISNHGKDPMTIHSIVPSNQWIKIIPPPSCPFQIKEMQSKILNIHVDWQQIHSTANGHIEINHDNRIQITAIPSTSLTELYVTPDKITCNPKIAIADIQITCCQNIQWQAFSEKSWITIIDGYRGKGNGTVKIRVGQNTMGMRSGFVKITAMNSLIHQNVKVVQSGNYLSIETPLKVRENDGILSNAAKISIPSKTPKQLKVKLSVSDSSALIVPEYVIIPAQKKSICFDIQSKNNTKPDGPHIVNVTAEAVGWASGIASVNILDDERAGVIYVGDTQGYKTIQSAIDDAAPDSSILVLSGTYNENICLTKPVHLCTANGPTQTIIKGNNYQAHTIEIAHSNVIVEGFTVIGADNYGQAGIYLKSEANNCVVKNNICGQDKQNSNYYGIYVDGGGFHTLSHNLCQHNKRFGVYLNQSNHNTLVKNTCQRNQRTGILLNQSQNNMIYKNIVKYHPKYGLNITYNSNHNSVFLNSFISNDNGNVYSQWSANIWQNTSPVTHNFGQGFLGNYFDDHPLDDQNNDGITDAFYQVSHTEISEYALSKKPEQYGCQTQIIRHQNLLVSDEMPEMQSKCLCAAGKSVLFQSSPQQHGKREWTERNARTGNICFVTPIQHHHKLVLQLGKVTPEGIFTKAGKEHEIIGDGKRINFRFCIFPGSFSIDTDEQFAFQVTNESPLDYSIWIGGGHTHISSYEHEHASPQFWTVGKDATFRSIQTALSLLADYQTDHAFTLTVLPGTYTENIKIQSPVALISAQGYTQTMIKAKRSDQHVFHVQSDHVRIEGFSIVGANRNDSSGICIDRGFANCHIESNRLGFDREHANDYGIIIHASLKNKLFQNQCIANEKHGIFLNTAFMNQLSYNSCYQNNGAGIYIKDSLLNHFTHNTCEKNGNDGIHLTKSSRNQIQFNTFAANDNYGLFIDADSFVNLIVLNNLVLNQGQNAFSKGLNQWSSDNKKTYQFCGHVLANYMGNYYGDHVEQDNDQNGLVDTPYNNNGMDHADFFALIRPYSYYELIHPEQKNKPTDKQSFDISNTIAATKPEIEEAAPIESLSETIHPPEIKNVKKSNFIKVEKASNPVETDKSIHPILLFTDVPPLGNRLRDLKGLVLNVAPESHHIAVYIHIQGKGWQSKPYPAAPMTSIGSDGRWECDITTAAFDQNADTIVAVLYDSDIMPPTLMNAPNLPDTIFEKSTGFVQNER